MATLAQKLLGPGDYISARALIPMTVTATANTDFLFTPPTNAVNVNYTVFTTTAFTAVTDAQLSIGSTVGGVDYVAAATIKAIGVYAPTRVNAAAATHLNVGGKALNIRIVQSGGSTAVGAATLVITYDLPI